MAANDSAPVAPPAIFAGPVAFVGAGRVAETLARAMQAAGLAVSAIASRNREKAERAAAAVPGAVATSSAQTAADASALVLLTVPDDAIEGVCSAMAWRPGQFVVHCSGATEVAALGHAADAGALAGAFHPLQMFADPRVALETLPGCTITIDAAPPLSDVLEQIARQVRCRPVRLTPGRRALYHASAYYPGPFLIALMQEAVRIWGALGATEDEALAALVPLLRGTVAAVLEGGLAKGMGGCVARGDVGTVSHHLEALEAFAPEMAALYRQLALRTIPLGMARGSLSAERAEQIREVLEAASGPDRSRPV